MTPEQEAEQRRIVEGQEQLTRERNATYAKHARRANRKALVLLLMVLNPEQREEFRKDGRFHVIGGSTGTRYRIRKGRVGNIDVFNGKRVAYRLCAHPTDGVPDYDVMASQALYLQDPNSEREFVSKANRHEVIRAPEVMEALAA